MRGGVADHFPLLINVFYFCADFKTMKYATGSTGVLGRPHMCLRGRDRQFVSEGNHCNTPIGKCTLKTKKGIAVVQNDLRIYCQSRL